MPKIKNVYFGDNEVELYEKACKKRNFSDWVKQQLRQKESFEQTMRRVLAEYNVPSQKIEESINSFDADEFL